MRSRSHQRGFTLVELMVVVAIIAVLSAIMIGMASRPYGANGEVISNQLVSEMAFARMRAIATRKVHQVTLYTSGSEQIALLEAAPTVGMTYTGTTWQTVEYKRIPTSAVVWSAEAGAITSTGNNPAQNTGLPYVITFKPDGTATASTIYVTDRFGTPHYYRVLVYHATGSSYARETW
jgi:prepilin-type N-terminal cleavage/methylation domain-containing protein